MHPPRTPPSQARSLGTELARQRVEEARRAASEAEERARTANRRADVAERVAASAEVSARTFAVELRPLESALAHERLATSRALASHASVAALSEQLREASARAEEESGQRHVAEAAAAAADATARTLSDELATVRAANAALELAAQRLQNEGKLEAQVSVTSIPHQTPPRRRRAAAAPQSAAAALPPRCRRAAAAPQSAAAAPQSAAAAPQSAAPASARRRGRVPTAEPC